MAPPRRPEIVIGLDVGKSSRWARIVTRDGKALASKPIVSMRHAPRLNASPSPTQHAT